MKRIILLSFTTLTIFGCDKDGISPRDRKNECADCVLEYTDNSSGSVVGTETKNGTTGAVPEPGLYTNFCDYIDLKDGNTTSLVYGSETITVTMHARCD